MSYISRDNSKSYAEIKKLDKANNLFKWVSDSGTMQDAFPMSFDESPITSFDLDAGISYIQDGKFEFANKKFTTYD